MRRQFLLFCTVLLGLTAVQAQNALFIPDTLSGSRIELNLQKGMVPYFNGTATATMGANGDILGPTLFLQHGDSVFMTVNNHLDDTTTVHWHGLHVAPENDGGPHTYMIPNATWKPAFRVLDRAATYWYHPHLHHKTDKHVSKGIAGLIIVRDEAEAALELPRTYGVDDIPLVLQTKDFDADNQIVAHSNSDDVLLVNATLNAFMELPAQVIRFRLLNGSSQRAFHIGLSNQAQFYQIASDGGLLAEPYVTKRLVLAPGERAEILVDLSNLQGQEISIKSFASELPNGIYGASNPGMGANMTLNGYSPNPLNGADFDLLVIKVVAQNSNPIVQIPATLVDTKPLKSADADITRTLTFTAATMGMNQLNGNFLINNTPFDMMKVNYDIPLDHTEIWSLSNQSGIAHPFHIHDVQFNIISRGGAAPAANEQGWKDVVLVRPMETVQFLTKFEDFFNSQIPYMYHCHLLTHEDMGMMGQFTVSTQAGISIANSRGVLTKLYPNPSHGSIELVSNTQIQDIEVCDEWGRQVPVDFQSDWYACSVAGLPNGLCLVKIFYANGSQETRRVLVRM